MGASEKRYGVYFTVREKALNVIKEKAYKSSLSISELIRKYLEETNIIPKEE